MNEIIVPFETSGISLGLWAVVTALNHVSPHDITSKRERCSPNRRPRLLRGYNFIKNTLKRNLSGGGIVYRNWHESIGTRLRQWPVQIFLWWFAYGKQIIRSRFHKKVPQDGHNGVNIPCAKPVARDNAQRRRVEKLLHRLRKRWNKKRTGNVQLSQQILWVRWPVFSRQKAR